MRKLGPAAALAAASLGIAASAFAQATSPKVSPKDIPEEPDLHYVPPRLEEALPEGPRGWLEEYEAYATKRAEEISKMDIWGVTSQLPKGIFSAKVQYNNRRASERFTGDGSGRRQVIDPITFDVDLQGIVPNYQGRPFLDIDLNPRGKGYGITTQISYGVTDRVNPYVEIPLQYITAGFSPVLGPSEAGDPANATTLNNLIGLLALTTPGSRVPELQPIFPLENIDDVCVIIELLGRPCPGFNWHTNGLEVGDIAAGVSWNFYRDKYFSLGITPRMFFPSGKIADPDNNIAFALGPELDRGVGTFGFGGTLQLDFRPPDPFENADVIFSVEYSGHKYLTDTARASPRFFKPDPVAKQLAVLGFESSFFPDLSTLERTYEYDPGYNNDLTLTATFSLFKAADIAVAWGWGYKSKPTVKSNLTEFDQLAQTLELFTAEEGYTLGVGATVPLFPFNIPAALGFSWKWNTGGRNGIIFEDNYTLGCQLFVPL